MNFSGYIAKFFLENRPLALLFTLGIVGVGIIGYFITPKQYNPEVTLPAFVISTQYSGATAQEVEMFVTRELEEKIAEIPGVDSISSISSDGGLSQISVQFIVGEDLETAKVKVFSKIYENLDFLADKNISQPVIKNISPDDVAIGVLAMTSQGGKFSQNILREKALAIAYRLQRIEGIANIKVYGGEKKALKIEVNPQELKNRNLSLFEVSNAIIQNNGRRIIGDITSDDRIFEVQVDAKINDVSTASTIIVSPGVMLGEIATISDGYRDQVSRVSFLTNDDEFSDAVYISFAKKKGVGTLGVMTQAQSIFDTISQEIFFSGINFSLVRNTAQVAQDAISGLGINLLQSITIVVLVLAFLLGGRASILVALAIPLTLLFVFFAGYLAGQTINRISLFALILSLGLLVDSATVVVENIQRHLHNQEPGSFIEKIYTAVNEVGIGLFLSTLTSVIVFLPMTQITGMMGPYMAPLAFFVPMALILSLVLAYTCIPFLASVIFKDASGQESLKVQKHSFFSFVENWYAKLLKIILRSNFLQLIILWSIYGLMGLSFLFIFFEGVHFQMLPKADKETFWVTIDLPEGTNFPQTHDIAKKLSYQLRNKNPDIISIQISSGEAPIVDFNGLFRNFDARNNPHQSSLQIRLDEDRSEPSMIIAQRVREQMKNLSFLRNTQWRVVEDPPGPPVVSTFVAKIFSEDRVVQEKISEKFQELLPSVKGITDIDTSQEKKFSRMVLSLDMQKAKENYISTQDIYQAISLSVEPRIIGEFSSAQAQEISYIEFSIPKKWRENPSDILDISLKNSRGNMIPLKSIVDQVSDTSVPSLYRDSHQSVEYITAEMQNRSIIYAVKDLIYLMYGTFDITEFSLYGVTVFDFDSQQSVRIEWGGEFEMTLDNFRDLLLAMMVAFMLVYVVLVGQFKSFGIPLLIMATVPLAFIGILPGFAFLDFYSGTLLTATALIGFIALLGIIVNNAIIYLEYLDILISRGMCLHDALIDAGKTRLRPIILTSLTTVLGSLTIAFDPVWSGLAWSIVFGLSLSTFLTLGIFPILYWRTQRKK